MKYILEGREIKKVDLMTWAKWFETADRQIGKDEIDGVIVSTVFLGIDHSFGKGMQPILFETMVFGGEFGQEQERYCTYTAAEEGHKRWVKKIKLCERIEPSAVEKGRE